MADQIMKAPQTLEGTVEVRIDGANCGVAHSAKLRWTVSKSSKMHHRSILRSKMSINFVKRPSRCSRKYGVNEGHSGPSIKFWIYSGVVEVGPTSTSASADSGHTRDINPTRQVMCPTEPHDRNPNALMF